MKQRSLETEAEIRKAAIELLARREHSCFELDRKLRSRVLDSELLDQVLRHLIRENLLSDQRFCEAYIRYRKERGYGPMRIRAELKTRGLTDSVIAEYLTIPQEEWVAVTAKLVQKKYGSNPDQDVKSRAKQQRFLYQRGFTSEQITQAMAQVGREFDQI